MKFLVDNQLPTALARFLSARGAVCQHVFDLDLAGATDTAIWRLAAERDFVIISKDEDFFHLASVPESKGRLVWIRRGNCRTKTLLAVIEQVWPKVEASLQAGDRIIEIR